MIKVVGDDPIEAAWQQVQEGWQDEAAHRRFLALCSTLERLPEAGKRYGQVILSDPARKPAAERWLEEVTTLAMQALRSTRTESTPDYRGPVRFAAFIVMLVLVGVSAWTLLRGLP